MHQCEGVGGREDGRGGWSEGVGREEEKPPQVKTRGDQLPTDGPDHTTRPFRSGVEFQADNAQLVCRSWPYKAAKPPLRKADHLSLAIGDMVFG